MSTGSRDEPSQREPEAPVGGLTEKTDERAAQNPAVNSWLLAQQVVRQRAHVVAEVIVARLAENGESLLAVLGHELQDEGAESRQGGMEAHVPRLQPRRDETVAAEVVPSVPSMAAERLAEDEGAAGERSMKRG